MVLLGAVVRLEQETCGRAAGSGDPRRALFLCKALAAAQSRGLVQDCERVSALVPAPATRPRRKLHPCERGGLPALSHGALSSLSGRGSGDFRSGVDEKSTRAWGVCGSGSLARTSQVIATTRLT